MAKRLTMLLSTKDQYVPENYIGITDLFLNPEYALPGYSEEQWCLGYKTLDEYRVKTFREIKKRFQISGARSFSTYWNGNLDAINSMGLNEFAKLSCFSELATAMICFEQVVKNKNNDNRRRFISFGIRKDIYEGYRESLREALEKGDLPKKANLFDNRKRRLNDLFAAPLTSITFKDKDGKNHAIQINKNEIFYKFERWCKIKGIQKKQGIYDAMVLMMEQNPVDGLEDVKAFTKNSGIDSREVVLSTCEKSGCFMQIKFPESITNQMRSIIRRFNSDPENKVKNKQLTTNTYITNAIAAYNKRMPLKYSDPIAYKEYLEIKKEAEYNDIISGKGVKNIAE